ncbi:hypothetical protein F2Q70_00011174 [Brassica cretica]|uniref:Uncharacterized protein n=1 Tax=Brassica cretica TaxID=69181 RepID=A0A8S9MAS4_BRACR|nr:hypothetical protein F2Q68_00004291 [Brassica cretica]KAF2615248.1 hypothetical protein F2Q70_00011174 [Brassica cretica]
MSLSGKVSQKPTSHVTKPLQVQEDITSTCPSFDPVYCSGIIKTSTTEVLERPRAQQPEDTHKAAVDLG